MYNDNFSEGPGDVKMSSFSAIFSDFCTQGGIFQPIHNSLISFFSNLIFLILWYYRHVAWVATWKMKI